jgi:hypothetical protein
MRWGLATKFEDDFTMGYRLWGGAATVLVGGAQRLFALGEFDRAGSVGVRGLACWEGVRWSNPERASPISINGPIWSLALLGTNLVTFGFFTAAGEATVNGWASWTGHAWHALAVPSPQGLIARAPMATDGARLWTFTESSLPWIHHLNLQTESALPRRFVSDVHHGLFWCVFRNVLYPIRQVMGV